MEYENDNRMTKNGVIIILCRTNEGTIDTLLANWLTFQLLSRGLIMWDSVLPSVKWVESHIPAVGLFLLCCLTSYVLQTFANYTECLEITQKGLIRVKTITSARWRRLTYIYQICVTHERFFTKGKKKVLNTIACPKHPGSHSQMTSRANVLEVSTDGICIWATIVFNLYRCYLH